MMDGIVAAQSLDFNHPAWLWLCALVPLLALASYRSLAGLNPARRAAALVARGVVIILLAFCLAEIQRVRRHDDLTVLFLMDRSYSTQALQQSQEDFIRRATLGKPPEDRIGMIDFARLAFLQQRPEHDYLLPPGRLPVMPDTDRTDIAGAMRLAMAVFPHDTAKRIVLMSDGNDNMGDVLAEARRARAAGIVIDVVPLHYEHLNEVYFDRMIAPTHAEPGEQVPLRMVLHSHRATTGTIAVYHNGRPIALPPEYAHVKLKPGHNTFFMKLTVDDPGAHTYQAVFTPDERAMDGVALNNTARAFSFVSGASRVLLITSNPVYDAPLVEALRGEQVKVDMKATAQLGEFGLLQMMSYSTIILANVPAAAFTETQLREFATYVKDMGSGLIMTGGDEAFGAGGWIGTPVEEVMPITFEVKHKRVIPRGALVLIMHSCEMPRGNFWGKEMAKKSADTISSQDYIGVLAYTYSPGGANWEVPLGLNTNRAAVKAKIDRMRIGDMPDFRTTMRMAYNELTKGRGRDAAQKHVIILSDGDATSPSRATLADYKRAKITVSTIAVGWGAHVRERTMIDIAKQTGGKYYRARNPKQLPQIFVKESKVVRRPLIVDEPFQPRIYHADSDLLAGIAPGDVVLPRLGGMVLSSVKPSPNVILPLIRATDDGDDPVLVHWQYELGKTVAFTSGYWPVWGRDWTGWAGFGKLWAQIVRWTMRQEAPANFETSTKIDGGRGRVVIDALDKDARFLNLLQLQAKVVGPDGHAVPLAFSQTGPGHYEATFDAEKAGQYLANVEVYDQGRRSGTIRTGASLPFSPEYRDLTPNEGLLRQVVEITGARWLDSEPEKSDVFSHDLPATHSRRPAWDWVLAWLLLPAFLLDVAIRRLASTVALSVAVELVVLFVLLFGLGLPYYSWWGTIGAIVLAELVGWTIRFRSIKPLFEFLTHTAGALAHTGERSEVALDHLKSTRDRIRDGLEPSTLTDLDVRSPPPTRVPSIPVAGPKPDAAQRFDAGDEQTDEPASDLRQAMGGAAPAQDSGKAPAPGTDDAKKDEAAETPTQRLLRQRRRRKRKPDE